MDEWDVDQCVRGNTKRNDDVKNLSGLIELLGRNQMTTQLRTDHKLVHKSNWKKAPERVQGLTRLMQDLAAIAE